MFSMLRCQLCIFVLLLLPSIGTSDEMRDAYRVSPEDTIAVLVARHSEFSGDFLVPSDGVVSIPVVGQISVAGKTLAQIADEVSFGLKSRLKYPEVTVTLRSAAMQRVYVLGAVSRPGFYDLKPGWRITEAIAAAGGLDSEDELNDCKVTVLSSQDGKRKTVEMTDVIRGASNSNLPIHSGDVITIESEEFPVYVMGKVRQPGLYRIRKSSAGIMEALALAGGTLEDSALDKIAITHVDQSTHTVDLVPGILSGKQGANVELQPGDLVVVPEELSRVAVLGYVNKPGFYSIKSGNTLLLSDAVGLAGGVENRRGEIGNVAIIRSEEGKQTRMVCDLGKFMRTGDMALNPEVKSGDVIYVPQTKKPDWDFVTRSLSAIGILINPFIP